MDTFFNQQGQPGLMDDDSKRQMFWQSIGRAGAQLLTNANTWSRTPSGPLRGVGEALQPRPGEMLKQQMMRMKMAQAKQTQERQAAAGKFFGVGGTSPQGAGGASPQGAGGVQLTSGPGPMGGMNVNPQMKARAAAYFKATGDAKGAMAMMFKRPAGLPIGTKMGPGGEVVSMPGAEAILRGRKKAGAPRTYIDSRTYSKEQALIKLQKEYEARAAAAPPGPERDSLENKAAGIERQLVTGNRAIPAPIQAKLVDLGSATDAASKLAGLLANPNIKIWSMSDRAEIAQQFQKLKLAYATLKGRGAHFTDSEQKMISELAGGDPTNWIALGIRGRADFVKKLRIAHQDMIRESKSIRSVWMTGRAQITPFPKGKGGDASKLTDAQLRKRLGIK